jgi:predicted PurR-regulated permease PerM
MDGGYAQPAGNGLNWRSLTLYLLTLSILVACALILWPFLPAITGAVVLAIVTQRPYNWIAAKIRNSALAASVSVVLVTLSLVVPAIFLIRSIARQVSTLVNAIQNGTAERGLHNFIDQFPRATAFFQTVQDNFDLTSAIEKSAGFTAQKLGMLLGGSIAVATQAVIMMFLLFFLYRDRKQVLSFLRSIIPLKGGETNYLLSAVNDTILATVLGRFLVAGIQGAVAGVTFAALGVSGAPLLSVATALFALIPSFGAFVIWLPVAIYLAATHHWVQAAILAAVGALIISSLDNFIYPVLVGTRIRLHTVAIFLSILGGIWLFGVTGLILGPILFALARSLLTVWNRRIESDGSADISEQVPG